MFSSSLTHTYSSPPAVGLFGRYTHPSWTPLRGVDDRADDESSQMQMETQLPRSICRRGVCAHLCVCGGFTQRAPGSRALQWLVKTPSRALGFELAFCQPSCQREAGNTERVCVCVCVINVCIIIQVCAITANRGCFLK